MSASELEKARAFYKLARAKRQAAKDEELEAKIKLMIAEGRFADAEENADDEPPKKATKKAPTTTKKREKEEDVDEEQEAEDDAAPTKKASTKPPKQPPADFECPGNVAADLACEVENSVAYHKQVQNPKTKKLIWACGKCRDEIIAAKKAANAAAKKLAKKQAATKPTVAVAADDDGGEVEPEQ